MPTLVRIKEPAVGSNLHADNNNNNNNNRSKDLDETTLSLNDDNKKDESLNDNSVDPNDETTMADKSINMLLDHSLCSSNEEDMDSSSCGDCDSDDSFRRKRRSSTDNHHRTSNDRATTNSHQRSHETENVRSVRMETEKEPASNYNSLLRPPMIRANDNANDDNDETRLSDSDSSSCGTPLQRQHGETLPNQPAKLSDSDASDSDSTCTTPPRRGRSSSQKTPSSLGNDEKHKKPFSSQEQKPSKQQPNQQHPYKSVVPMANIEWRKQRESNVFRAHFGTKVSDFERLNPRVKLCDYNSLAPEEQRVEQDRVMRLLGRLGIRGGSSSSLSHGCANDSIARSPGSQGNDTMPRDASIARLNDSHQSFDQSPNNAPGVAETRSNPRAYSSSQQVASLPTMKSQDNDVGQRQNDLSLQLSPIAAASPSQMPLQTNESCARFSAESPVLEGGSPIAFQPCDDDSSMSERSVEVTRGAADPLSNSPPMFQSPPLKMKSRSNTSKRNASTSGKRGNDMCRTRLNQDSSFDSSGDEAMPPPSQHWNSSDDSLSLLSAAADEQPNNYPFSASQSPITDSARRKGSRSQQRQKSDSSYRGNSQRPASSRSSRRQPSCQDDSRYCNDETIHSVDATHRDDREGRGRLREISTNVALKDGVPFHYNPLHIKRSKRTNPKERTKGAFARHRTAEFRDPLEMYFGQEAEELHHIFEWVLARDNAIFSKWSSDSKGIVFSLDRTQIVNVVIKLLMEADVQSSRGAERYGDESLSGQTLIVLRNKEDIAFWERALREQTPFSVISHADLPASERKRSTTAAKCATYDVVISTYDSMKGQDMTTQLDDDGHAVARQNAESQANGGWMTKRSSASSGSSQLGGSSQRLNTAVQCKQLSVLHHVKWRRILFADELGRKCFLAKLGTARASAARAINGDARFIFFTDTAEDTDATAFESLHRSDKRAIQSVAAALRIEIEDEEEDLLDVIIDPGLGI